MSELMQCIFCDAVWQSDRDGCTNWRVTEIAGRRFYICPKEFPAEGASAEEFARAKKRAQDKITELLASEPEPACQICGCTELTPCIQNGEACGWIVLGVLCSACLTRVQVPRTPEELANLMAPLQQLPVELALNGISVFQLLSTLQLALSHPRFPEKLGAEMEEFARVLQSRIGVTPQLAAVCEMGWHRGFDHALEPPRRIWLPGDPT